MLTESAGAFMFLAYGVETQIPSQVKYHSNCCNLHERVLSCLPRARSNNNQWTF
jgi:hypothetical protein